MGSVTTLAFVVALTTAADVQLLFFSSQTCLPCQQAKPVVSQLAGQGYPIVQIDINQQPQVADQYRIQQIPCFVLTVNGQEVRRVVGAQPAQTLVGMIESVQASDTGPPAAVPTNSSRPTPDAYDYAARSSGGGGQVAAPPRAAPQAATSPDEYNGWRDGIGFVSTTNATTAQQRALAATVRLHVDENNTMAVGSGTVIHQQGDSALVLTCGHLFREAGQNARVTADVGFPHSPRKVDAKVLYYEADKHDIALVVIRTAEPLTVARIAPAQLPMHEGDQVFGVGCGGGDDPTILGTRVKALTNYSGVVKYDTFSRPQQGRSGGGLFSAGGQLIGVCNAAAVNVDEGIYAGLQSIYAALDANHLTEEIAGGISPQLVTNEPNRSAQPAIAAGASTVGLNQPNRLGPPARPIASPATVPPVDVQPIVAQVGGIEVICVVRSSDDPSQTETVVIRNPSPELLQQIELAARGDSTEIPERWQTVPARTANLRAQSPR